VGWKKIGKKKRTGRGKERRRLEATRKEEECIGGESKKKNEMDRISRETLRRATRGEEGNQAKYIDPKVVGKGR